MTCSGCIHEDACKHLIDERNEVLVRCKLFERTGEGEVVRRGHWIKRGNEKKCSVCGFIYYSNNDDWNGCPNCLARMV